MNRVARIVSLSALLIRSALIVAGGCATAKTESPPSNSALERAGRRSGPEQKTPQARASATTTAPVVRAQDRDPEEERRKMSLSREHSARAQAALRRGATQQAVEEARQALKIHEQNVEAMLVIAEAFYSQKRYELVQSITTSVLEVDPKVLRPEESSRAYNLKGFAFLAEGNRVAAMRAFRKAAELDERNAAAWNNLGVQYMLQEEFAVAQSCFHYALELDPGFLKAQLNYGAALRAQGQTAAALQVFLRVVQARPNYAEAHFNLGVLYLDAESLPELDAKTRLDRAIREFVRYKELAVAAGATALDSRPASAGGAAARVVTGKELVSPMQADLYIGVARKGLEREERREDRAKRRSDAASSADAELERPSSEPSVSGGSPSPGREAPPATSAPGSGGAAPPSDPPQRPTVAPGTSNPSNPSNPTQRPSSSPPSPQQPTRPSSDPPTGGSPTPQQPNAPAPQPTAPQRPSSSPAPQQRPTSPS